MSEDYNKKIDFLTSEVDRITNTNKTIIPNIFNMEYLKKYGFILIPIIILLLLLCLKPKFILKENKEINYIKIIIILAVSITASIFINKLIINKKV